MIKMTSPNGFLHLLFFLIYCKVTNGLTNVKLTIVPSTVNITGSAVLYCNYDLQEAPLYTVKWYWSDREFYRFTETDVEEKQVFNEIGFKVDLTYSNSTQVFLRNISDFKFSSNFTCEVTDDGQPISSLTDVQAMLVVQLPAGPPTISVGHEPLDYGHLLRANCTSPPSKPQAVLKMSLNNIIIGRSKLTATKPQEPAWSDLSVETRLTDFYFKQGGEKLVLKCVAQVVDFKNSAVLELASARHPVPERVSAYGSRASVTNYTPIMYLIIFTFPLFVIS